MKFSELSKEQWDELHPYLDTCLLPITGLTGDEAPWEAIVALEQLRDVMDLIEQPYGGRIVTYPAIQYADLSDEAQLQKAVNGICERLKHHHFSHVVVVTANEAIAHLTFSEADLVITSKNATSEALPIAQSIETMWRNSQ